MATFQPVNIAEQTYTRSNGIPWGQTPIEEFSSTDNAFEENRFTPAESAARFDETGRATSYMVLGATKAVYAGMGRLAVHNIIGSLSASADVVSLASIEIDLSKVEAGSNVVLKWRGKPVFVKHRTRT